MKNYKFIYNLFLSLFLSFLLFAESKAQNVTLNSQAQVNAFGATNPTTVNGNLTISGSDITELTPLSTLTSISGDLVIFQNSVLTSLSGLDALTSLGGLLYIAVNSSLTSLAGLDALSSVGSNLYVQNNTALTEFCALYTLLNGDGLVGTYNVTGNASNPTIAQVIAGGPCIVRCIGNVILTTQAEVDAFDCTEITGNLTISGADISDLTPLSTLTSVGGNLSIRNNALLTNLAGLDAVTSIGGRLSISSNNTLTSLAGLDAITSLGGGLSIISNNALTSLAGLDAITSLGGDLYISSNNTLTSLAGLDAITSLGGGLSIISNNALTSLAGLNAIASVGLELYISDNAALTSLAGLNAIASVGLELYISDNAALTSLAGLNSVASVGGDLSILYNAALTTLAGLNTNTIITDIGGDIDIRGNSTLTSLYGLPEFRFVHGSFYISSNPSLISISGLYGVYSIQGSLFIGGNSSLTSLAGLDALSSVGANLYVQNNTALTEFCGLYALLNGGGLVGTYNVTGNASNPTMAQIIVGGPCGPCIGSLTLTTQAEVDAFYCTEITGNLEINEGVSGNITDLTPLSTLTSVGGSLYIGSNSSLTNLAGLNALNSVGRFLYFSSNSSLTSLAGLDALNSVGANLYVRYNSALTEFCGLYALLNGGGLVGTYNVIGNASNPTNAEIIAGGPCPLPVELASFTADVAGNIVTLNWHTATEVKNYGFDIERKFEHGNYSKIGFVIGNGNSNIEHNYNYEDNLSTPGKYTYRLKQIDTDGAFEYSPEVNADISIPNQFVFYECYPNPFNNSTVISWQQPSSGFVSLKIFNVLGKEVGTLVNTNIEAGKHSINYNADKLATGMYILRIQIGSFISSKKMVLLK